MKIFLTGGTGFLGQELLKVLLQRGHEITALVRSPQKACLPTQVRVVAGAVENPLSYQDVLKGQDVFVHIAALVKMWVRDRSQFDRVNVEATEKALQLAAQAGIPKFVYTSSFMALGPSNGAPLKEDDPRREAKLHNDYERTKFLADQIARKYLEKGYPLYILYPGVIYGPGNLTDGNIVAKSIIPFLKGRMPFGLPLKEWSYVFVQDVVQGFLKVIEQNPPSHRYILGGENHDGKSFYQTLYQVTGKKPPTISLPFWTARLAGYGEYLLALLFDRQPSLLTHEVAEIYSRAWSLDSSRAQAELDYKITPLKEGMIQMISWLKNSGLIP